MQARAAFGAYTLLLVVVNALPVICIYCYRDALAAQPFAVSGVVSCDYPLVLDCICHVDIALAAAATCGVAVAAVADAHKLLLRREQCDAKGQRVTPMTAGEFASRT
jgi:hypothetical protein